MADKDSSQNEGTLDDARDVTGSRIATANNVHRGTVNAKRPLLRVLVPRNTLFRNSAQCEYLGQRTYQSDPGNRETSGCLLPAFVGTGSWATVEASWAGRQNLLVAGYHLEVVGSWELLLGIALLKHDL